MGPMIAGWRRVDAAPSPGERALTTGLPVPAQLEAIARRIVPDGRVTRAWTLKGGVSSRMTAFEIATGSETRAYVLREPPGHSPAAREHRLLGLLGARGLAAPTPRLLGAAGDILLNDWLVVDYIEGEPHYGAELGERRAAAMARALAAIHAVDTTGDEFAFLPGGDDGHTLLHGDFWPGNVLWRGEELVAVIDWEDVLLGDPLLDVAITRLDLALIHGAAASELFTRRYVEQTGRDVTRLSAWDARAVARQEPHLEAWNGGWAEMGRPDLTMDVIRERFATFASRTME